MLLAEHTLTADDLATTVGMISSPVSWQHHWAAYLSWCANGNDAKVLWTLPAAAAQLFDLPPAVIDPLHAAMTHIDSDPILKRLSIFLHFLVYGLGGEIGENTNDWKLPPTIHGLGVKLLSLAVLVSGTDRAIANCAAFGMGEEITSASLAFIGQRVREVRQKRNQWGIESLGFLRHYVRAELFRLGRLTFRVSPFPGLGSPHAAEQSLNPGDLRIEVHVAGGAKLDPDECDASYRAAIDQFTARYRSHDLKGFTCVSWLLDPALKQLLPAESNILHFAEPYHLLDRPGDHRQAYDLIFGDPDADPQKFVATQGQSTTLQRALAAHVTAGGMIRAFTGFIPWNLAAAHFRSLTEAGG